MKIFPKLYKQKNKKIMSWQIQADTDSIPPRYIVEHGYVDGKIQQTSTEVKKGKNSGKKNATTPQEQCLLEAEALWTKQRDRKGYNEDINADKPIMPMLAHKWQDHKHRVNFPLLIQSKYDGTRCLAHINNGNVRLISRENREYIGLNHIIKPLQKLPDMILDGELYSNEINFREIISAIKKEGGNALTPKIEYHVYDIISDKIYEKRLEFLNTLNALDIISYPVIIVPTYQVNSEKEIKDYHDKFKKDGYEGAIIRDPSGKYECDKRSKSLLKYKTFQDKEYTIIGASENKGKLVGTCTFVCQTLTGETFDVMPDGTYEERCQYWQDWQDGAIQSGDFMTVEFFEYTDDVNEIPRFPVGKGIRNYE